MKAQHQFFQILTTPLIRTNRIQIGKIIGFRNLQEKLEYASENYTVITKIEFRSNLYVTSKNKTTNSPIHEFKVLHKD